MQDIIREIIHSPDTEEKIRAELERLKSVAFQELKIAKAEKKFGSAKVTPPITIMDSAVGVLNVGNITGNIERNVVALHNSGHKEIAETIEKLIELTESREGGEINVSSDNNRVSDTCGSDSYNFQP